MHHEPIVSIITNHNKPLTYSFDLYYISMKGGNNSAVECNLAKVEVAGSNPVSRSIKTSE